MDVQGNELLDKVEKPADTSKPQEPFTWTQIAERTNWKYLFIVLMYHVGFVAALAFYTFRISTVPMQWWTVAWGIFVGLGTSVSITAGAHRLWGHRSYKAKLPLRVMLMILYSAAGMYPLYYWIRDHRVHHKYVDTDADPHNSRRGFFYSHFGWLFMKRHPDCLSKVRNVDMTDIQADPVVMFQKKYSAAMQLIWCYIIPSAIAVTMWNETILHAVLTQCFIRQVVVLNITCCVNSVAHLWGSRPYNRLIYPVENQFVCLVSLGEGSHNYHHTFPWDYKASEFPYLNFNITTMFIDTMAKLGLAYDRREASSELVDKVVRRIGYKSKTNSDH